MEFFFRNFLNFNKNIAANGNAKVTVLHQMTFRLQTTSLYHTLEAMPEMVRTLRQSFASFKNLIDFTLAFLLITFVEIRNSVVKLRKIGEKHSSRFSHFHNITHFEFGY